MSKKKNTLKDLNEFLKQQAASLVTPEKLPQPEKESEEKPEPEKAEPKPQPRQSSDTSAESIVNDLSRLAEKEGAAFRKKFYDIIIQSLEAQHHQVAEDKMLINTALYLKHGDRWREAIRDYWKQQE
jgi:hypothetical protein